MIGLHSFMPGLVACFSEMQDSFEKQKKKKKLFWMWADWALALQLFFSFHFCEIALHCCIGDHSQYSVK